MALEAAPSRSPALSRARALSRAARGRQARGHRAPAAQQLARSQRPLQQLVVAQLAVARPEAVSRSPRALVSSANAGGAHSRRDLFGQALSLRPCGHPLCIACTAVISSLLLSPIESPRTKPFVSLAAARVAMFVHGLLATASAIHQRNTSRSAACSAASRKTCLVPRASGKLVLLIKLGP